MTNYNSSSVPICSLLRAFLFALIDRKIRQCSQLHIIIKTILSFTRTQQHTTKVVILCCFPCVFLHCAEGTSYRRSISDYPLETSTTSPIASLTKIFWFLRRLRAAAFLLLPHQSRFAPHSPTLFNTQLIIPLSPLVVLALLPLFSTFENFDIFDCHTAKH